MENEKKTSTGIRVVILDSGISMKEIPDARIIRVKSDKYNLLIMKDYWPIIGEMRGSVTIEGNTSAQYENITAFYSMVHNVFHLIIKDHDAKDSTPKINEETKK